MNRFARILLAVAAASLSACSTGENADPIFVQDAAVFCPNDLPSACDTPTPSYQNVIAPILRERCDDCHTDYAAYAEVYKSRGPILDQVYACKMPLAGDSPLTPADRHALLGWLSCSAPQN